MMGLCNLLLLVDTYEDCTFAPPQQKLTILEQLLFLFGEADYRLGFYVISMEIIFDVFVALGLRIFSMVSYATYPLNRRLGSKFFKCTISA